MQINDFAPVKYQEFDNTRPSFGGIIASEIGKGGQVEISIGNETVLVDINPVDGSWKWAAEKDFVDGTYSLSIRAIDLAGNTSKPALFSVIIDTTPPEAPILINLKDDVGAEQGSFDPSKVIDDPRPTLTGVAQKNSIVYLRDENNNDIGSAQTDERGIWVLEPTQDLAQGVHNLHLVAVETFAGKTRVGSDSQPFALNISDHVVPPNTVVIVDAQDNAGAVTGKLLDGAITDDTTPELHGEATIGSTVTVYYRLAGSNVWAGSETVTLNLQNWSWTPSAALPPGKYEFQASIGNASSELFTLDINVPAVIETKVTIDSAFDDVGSATGALGNNAATDDTKPTLHGTAEANGKVVVRWSNGAGTEGSATVDVDSAGRWSWAPSGDLAAGTWSFSAKAVSATDWNSDFALKIVAAAADLDPVLVDVLDDVGAVKGALNSGDATDDTKPTLNGTAEANATVFIRIVSGSNSEIVSVKADNNGAWSFTPATDLVEGQHSFSVGKDGVAFGTAFDLTISQTADREALIDHAVDDFGAVTGDLASGDTTDDATPTLLGTGPAYSKIVLQYKLSNGNWNSVTVDADASGNWQWTAPSLANGTYTFQVQKVGGEWSNDFTLTIDPSVNIETRIDHANDNMGSKIGDLASGDKTDDTTPTLHGTAPGKSLISIRYSQDGINWTVKGVQADQDGNWQWTPTPLAEGNWKFQVEKPDGSWTNDFTLTIDATFDRDALIDHAVDNVGNSVGDLSNGSSTDDTTPTLHGTGPANTTLTVRYKLGNASWSSATVDTDATGKWNWTPSALSNGTYTFQVQKAGGSYGNDFKLTIDVNLDKPHKPTIDDAYDDFGSYKGPVKHDGNTDDSTPTIRGSGTAGEIIHVRYRLSNQTWYNAGSTTVAANGKWELTSPKFSQDGTWDFEAKASKGSEESDWSNRFWVKYADSSYALEQVLDDVGSKQGAVANGAIIDDETPTLQGRAPANATVYIRAEGIGYGATVYTTKANAAGEWSWEAPKLGRGEWNFSISKTSGSWGPEHKIIIDVNQDVPARIISVFDNAGETTGALFDGFNTDDRKPEIVGAAPALSTVFIRYTLGSTVKTASVKADAQGKWIFEPADELVNGAWKFEAQSAGKPWSQFNLNVVDPAISKYAQISFVTDASGNHQYKNGEPGANTTKIVHGTGVPDSTFTLEVLANVSLSTRYQVTVGKDGTWSQAIDPVGDPSNGDILNKVTYSIGDIKNSQSQFFLPIDGVQLNVMDYIYADEGSNIGPVLALDTFSDLSPVVVGHGIPGSEFKIFLYGSYVQNGKNIYIDPQTKVVKVNDDGSWKVEFSEAEFKQVSSNKLRDSYFIIGEPGQSETYQFKPFKFSKTTTFGIAEADEVIDNNAIYHIDVQDIISEGHKDLFIENSKSQLMVQGKEGDIVKLEDILPENAKDGEWTEQTGNVTIAGVEYHVYSNNNSDAELLVQQGVKTEII